MTGLEQRALRLLRSSLGQDDAQFHEHQFEAIRTLVEDRGRLLVVQRTGWGKSAVYFIATKLLRDQGFGPTVIISPLLALMRNQIESAARYGVALGSINSSNSGEENDQTAADLLNGTLDAIIISPEQLAKPDFVENTLRPVANRVGLFVIDEAHCISDWGHDFRPDYKRIISILRFLPPNLPVLATTATANQRVMSDIEAQLGEQLTVFRGGLMRESLRLQTIILPDRSHRLAWLADTLPLIEGTGIIYTATTRDAELVADWLSSRGLNVAAYYSNISGLTTEENRRRRLQLEQDLLQNRLKALVATSALGMGYDKPDLAFVIHFQNTGSVISYYQQVGRAGRGIPSAYGVLLSGTEDDDIQKYFIDNAFPKEFLVSHLLAVLDAAPDGFTGSQIEQRVNARPMKIRAALKYLAAESPSPILVTNRPMRYHRTVTEYRLPIESIQRLSDSKKREWQTMLDYLSYDGCLMTFLARELDDSSTQPCNRCQNCDPDSVLPTTFTHETGIAASAFLQNQAIIIPPKHRAGSRIEVKARFPSYGFASSFRELEHESGRALCRWEDAGWGEAAAQGKRKGCFDGNLVKASATLIRDNWRPDPAPIWVTYVPSHRHPALVADFAQELARKLGLPCIDAVQKVNKNSPQKRMENTHFRCRNLDGAFTISSRIKPGPVLLIDDIVDSGWTFAVIAALLRRAGSGPVFPFAIASTSITG